MPDATQTTVPVSAHAHHFSLGQAVGLAMLALQAYHQQDAPNSGGPKAFTDPATVIPYLQGVMSLFPPQPAD